MEYSDIRGGNKFPKQLIWAVAAICVMPFLLNVLGFDFETHAPSPDAGILKGMTETEAFDSMHFTLAGSFVHTILEWSAFCIAVLTAFLAFGHYKVKGDIVAPIIGMALFWAGCMDAFHTLAADRLIEATADNRNLVPFTWTICRTFNALIPIVGVCLVLMKSEVRKGPGKLLFISVVSILFGVTAYAVVHYFAVKDILPRTMYPGSFFTRPWDLIPLGLYLFAGIFLYPFFYKRRKSFLAFALWISVIPDAITQLHMSLGSEAIFDNHFNIAHFVKIMAYFVPFCGLGLEHIQAHRMEMLAVKKSEDSQKKLLDHTRDLESTNIELERHVAERKRTEKALIASEEKYRSLFEESKDVVFISTPDGKILDINQAGIDLWGYDSKEDLLRINIARDLYVNTADREHLHNVLKEDGYVKDYELSLKRRDGKPVNVLETAVGVRNKDGEVVMYRGIIRDITERKKLEAQLLQSQKIEAVGRLAGGVAHDFNNLLQAIMGYCELLLHRLDAGDPVKKDISEIKKAGERASSLTRQLLAFSRRQVLQPKVIDLNEVIIDMEKMLRRLISADIELTVTLTPDIGRIKADRGQVEQVVMNLAINAHDAMPSGGKLSLETENTTVDELYCNVIPDARPGDFVCLTVADTGVGMVKETIDQIFEPFFTTKELGEGTGLGLSTVYGIVRQHDGWINVYSEPGRGSFFKIYLQRYTVDTTKDAKETVSLQDVQGMGERILLVEDEDGVRRYASRALSENGYIVLDAPDAETALNIFEREEGKFDLIFTDSILPDKNGIQLVDQLLSRTPDLPVLLCSGYTDQKSQWPIIQARGYRFLQKPYDLANLLETIKALIRQ